jgi:hypothetical protein
MKEHDAGGNFIDVLTARSRSANKLFLDVLLPNTQGLHTL